MIFHLTQLIHLCLHRLTCYTPVKVPNPRPAVHWPWHCEDPWTAAPRNSISEHSEAFTTPALHHTMSGGCAYVFVDALCVQTSCMHVSVVHCYCCGFICVLSHVLECVHLHLGSCECAWVYSYHKHTHTPKTRTHTHTHISISSIVVLTVFCHAWTSPPFPHIYAKLGSCQSVTLVT